MSTVQHIDQFSPDEIEIPASRLRAVSEDAVNLLVESIREQGLRTPLAVLRIREDDERFVLVAGAHRLEACKRLGVDLIDAIVFDDPVEARLWEIAENLHRSDLTVQERAEHIAEWVRIMGERLPAQLGPAVLPDGRKSGPQHQQSGINAASRKLGIERKEAHRAVKIASISPEAKQAAAAAGLNDNQSALLAVAAAPLDEQVKKVEQLRAAKAQRLLDEEEAREGRKANAATDSTVRLTAAQEFANWINDNCAASELNQVIAWLQVIKPSETISALRRMAA